MSAPENTSNVLDHAGSCATQTNASTILPKKTSNNFPIAISIAILAWIGYLIIRSVIQEKKKIKEAERKKKNPIEAERIFLEDILEKAYGMLGLPKDAKDEDVKKRWQDISLICHSDKTKDLKPDLVVCLNDYWQKFKAVRNIFQNKEEWARFCSTGCNDDDPIATKTALAFFNHFVPLPQNSDTNSFGGMFEDTFSVLELWFFVAFASSVDTKGMQNQKLSGHFEAQVKLREQRFTCEVEKLKNDLIRCVKEYRNASNDSQWKIDEWRDSIKKIAEQICEIPIFGPSYADALGAVLTEEVEDKNGTAKITKGLMTAADKISDALMLKLNETLHEDEVVRRKLNEVLNAMNEVSLCGVQLTLRTAMKEMGTKSLDVFKEMGKIFKETSDRANESEQPDLTDMLPIWRDVSKEATVQRIPQFYIDLCRYMASTDYAKAKSHIDEQLKIKEEKKN